MKSDQQELSPVAPRSGELLEVTPFTKEDFKKVFKKLVVLRQDKYYEKYGELQPFIDHAINAFVHELLLDIDKL